MATNITRDSAYNEGTLKSIGFTVQAETATLAMAFHGEFGGDAAFQEKDREGLGRGDAVSVNYMPIDEDDVEPKGEADKTVGQEMDTEDLESDTVSLTYLKYDRGVNNVVNAQGLVSWSVMEREKTSLARRVSNTIERWHVYQLAGTTAKNNAGNRNRLTWGNAAVAPDVDHWLDPDGIEVDGSTVTETTISNNAAKILTGETLRMLEKRACTNTYWTYPVVPCSVPGLPAPLYVAWASPEGYDQLLENSDHIITLHDAAIQGGGDFSAHPLISRSGFIYSQTLVLRHPNMPLGQSGTSFIDNVERLVWFGAGAMTCVYGEGYGDSNHWGYAEHQVLRDISMMTDTIQGGKVAIVDGKRWASAVVSHYSSRTVA